MLTRSAVTTHFKTKTILEDKEGYLIIIKGSIHQENRTVIHTCAHNKKVTKYIQAKLDRIEARNRQFNSNSLKLQYPIFNKKQTNQAEKR